VRVTVGKDRLKLVLNRLNEIQLEPLRLRLVLMPGEELDEREIRELEYACKEAAQGLGVNVKGLIEEKGTGVYWSGLTVGTQSSQGDIRYAG
jgi:hypothetical protein